LRRYSGIAVALLRLRPESLAKEQIALMRNQVKQMYFCHAKSNNAKILISVIVAFVLLWPADRLIDYFQKKPGRKTIKH
jgi:hypothetical protein